MKLKPIALMFLIEKYFVLLDRLIGIYDTTSYLPPLANFNEHPIFSPSDVNSAELGCIVIGRGSEPKYKKQDKYTMDPG